MQTSLIKFRASFAEPGSFGLIKAKEVVFQLGLGPCGRFVTALDWNFDKDHLVVMQTSYPEEPPAPPKGWRSWFIEPQQDDVEIKTFVYKMSDVHGRITALD